MNESLVMDDMPYIQEREEQDLQALKSFVSAMVDLGDETWKHLQSLSEYRKAKKNEILQREGQRVEHCFFLVSGVAREHILFNDGRDVNSAFHRGPALIGSVSTYRANIDAGYSLSMLTTGYYYRIDSSTLVDVITRHPQGENWLNTILIKAYTDVQRRLLFLLHKNAEERLLEFIDTYPDLMTQIPDYHIASYLGITPVTMHRAKSKIKRINT